LSEFYTAYLAGQDSATFITAVSQSYTVGALERLGQHSQCKVRRAALLALGFVATFDSNTVLGRALHDEDRAARTIAENAIRCVWRRDGSIQQQQQLGILVRLNASQQYDEAIRNATSLLLEAASFAEIWNQRAISYYNTGQFRLSIEDCRQALEFNPYHFDAVTGMGQCHLQLGEHRPALEAFRRSLRLNPSLEGVRAGIEYLERTLKDS
jgi:tetratricopeptide (TPR) repeat protein